MDVTVAIKYCSPSGLFSRCIKYVFIVYLWYRDDLERLTRLPDADRANFLRGSAIDPFLVDPLSIIMNYFVSALGINCIVVVL